MREIKFRGRSVSTGQWVYGYYQAGKGEHPHIISWWTVQQHEGDIWDEIDFAEVDPETVGQYTGLKDRNGKDIYEEDVYYDPNKEMNMVVCYDSIQARYKAVPIELYKANAGNGGWTGYEVKGYAEVIGNIFEDGGLVDDYKKSKDD